MRVTGNVVVAALLADELAYTTRRRHRTVSVLGLPIKMLAAIGVKPSLSLVVRPEIKTVADFKGKAIAISTPGTTTDFTARDRQALRTQSDRDIIPSAWATSRSAWQPWKAGTVAGATVPPAQRSQGRGPGIRLLVFSGDFMEDSLLGVLGTSERRIKERPEQAKKMVRAIVKALLFIRQQPEQVTTCATLLEIGLQAGRQKLRADHEDHEPRWQRHRRSHAGGDFP